MPEHLKFSRRMASLQPSFIREILKACSDPDIISFAGGLPNDDYFPAQRLSDIAGRLIAEQPRDILQYGQSEGEFELRETIATSYRERFQLNVCADNILVTNGSQQAFDLIGKVFIDQGDKVVIESPAYLGAIQSLSMFEPQFLPVAIDEQGMELDELATVMKKRPKLIYTVPNFQNPTGYSYSIERRAAMATQVSKSNCIIVEDDPYGELRFEGETPPSFYQYLPEQTLLLGSFSKIISPGLRIGWIVAPTDIMQRLIIAKQAADLHSSRLSQHLILAYLQDADFQSHLNRLRHAYQQRHLAMSTTVDRLFGTRARCSNPKGGMFMWLEFVDDIDTMKLFKMAAELGVVFVPGQAFHTGCSVRQSARLNFSASSLSQIEKGMTLLYRAFQQYPTGE